MKLIYRMHETGLPDAWNQFYTGRMTIVESQILTLIAHIATYSCIIYAVSKINSIVFTGF